MCQRSCEPQVQNQYYRHSSVPHDSLCFMFSVWKVSEGIILKISLSCWDRREDMASPLIGRVKSSTKREKGFQKAW